MSNPQYLSCLHDCLLCGEGYAVPHECARLCMNPQQFDEIMAGIRALLLTGNNLDIRHTNTEIIVTILGKPLPILKEEGE